MPTILAPVDTPDEVPCLIDAGAESLYCGFVPRRLMREYDQRGAINRRTFAAAQVASRENLERMAAAARGRGVPLWVTANAASYDPASYDPLLEILAEAREAGAAGFIAADWPLVTRLIERGLGPVSLSTMAGVMNAAAARFWHGAGVARITLPRDLGIGEIAGLAGATPEVTYDAFLLFGACANLEACCRWPHDDPGRVWPCVREYRVRPVPDDAAGLAAAAAQTAWGGLNRAWACGLCALPALAALPNVDGLKIVGRGAPTSRKLAGVVALRELLDLLGRGVTGEEFRRRACAVKAGRLGGPCLPHLCYYPEFLP